MNFSPSTTPRILKSMVRIFLVPVLVGGCGESTHSPATGTDALGPEPGRVDHVAVVTEGTENIVSWVPAQKADRYIVLWSHERQDLVGSRPGTPYFVAPGSPHKHVNVDTSRTTYYRVAAIGGSRIGQPSPIAGSTALREEDASLSNRVSPALFDIDGDGCLDAVGAYGDCEGGFIPVDPELQGIAGLFSPGRVNRDSRFADFNGDGLTDIFTNVYSRADNGDSRAILHINNGDGTFREDDGIRAMDLGGYGETILAADYNNDGHIDLFVPNYWHLDDGGQYWLLINDGSGVFENIAEKAGVAVGVHARPEGAQALDFNEDGWIDIYVGSQLFINNGDMTFTDRRADYRLPLLFDEGLKFADFDLDGDLDLVHHDSRKTRLFLNNAGIFDDGTVFNESNGGYGFGLNVCDINGDGFRDVVVANNDLETDVGAMRLFINVHGELHRTSLVTSEPAYNDLVVCADLNGDNTLDLLARHGGFTAWLNSATDTDVIVIRVMGADGQANQQGRIVRITPAEMPDYSTIRIVESGSGYMAQAGYKLVVGAPWPGDYEVSVRFAGGWVTAQTMQGTSITIHEDGRTNVAAIQ